MTRAALAVNAALAAAAHPVVTWVMMFGGSLAVILTLVAILGGVDMPHPAVGDANP